MTMNRVAVLQSNYIPWKGYFDIIHDVDLFIFYDEVQYTKCDWRNRNKIYTAAGLKWLSVPVSSHRTMAIDEVKITDTKWQQSHFDSLKANYSKAPYWGKYKDFLAHIYLETEWEYLYQLNRCLIEQISRQFLGIQTRFADSRDFASVGQKHEKLLSVVKAAKADLYLSGPAAKDYIIAEDYAKAGIDLRWKDYSGYPEYKQMHEPFEHNVTVLDLLLNVGDAAPYYIWGWREQKPQTLTGGGLHR